MHISPSGVKLCCVIRTSDFTHTRKWSFSYGNSEFCRLFHCHFPLCDTYLERIHNKYGLDANPLIYDNNNEEQWILSYAFENRL